MESPSAARKNRATLFKAASFALIGAVNTVVDFGVFIAAYRLLGWPLVPANILAWLVAVSFSYVMNSHVTFAAESERKLTWRAYGAFVASGAVGAAVSTAALVAASYVVPVLWAKLVAIGVSFAVNFTLSHFVVFRPRPK
ncbi:MAG TPA: GtrA family protein [Xanthobacteraceae bacterium]|nr:GtrA family protein [Xanthobacteraceae bacterium]